MKEADIRAFQAGRHDWEGKPLRVDGDLGPRTRWALDVARLEPLRQAIVARACSMVGQLESEGASNRSQLIDGWNRRCGAPLGSPWCAAFASWCISVDGLPDVREASAQELGRLLRRTTLIQPADVMWYVTGKQTGHCGIVIGCGAGEVACVEGNRLDGVRLARRNTSLVNLATPLTVQALPGVPPGLPLVAPAFEGTR